jgi:hypothetical protein
MGESRGSIQFRAGYWIGLRKGPQSLPRSTVLNIKLNKLERELASLRHMEKIRGEPKDGRRFVMLWQMGACLIS